MPEMDMDVDVARRAPAVRQRSGDGEPGGLGYEAYTPAQAALDRRERVGLIGSSPATQHLLQQVATVGRSEARVLVTGESGTGKELIARLLHEESARRDAPFLAINCAAFPLELLEAELFGHERGAFSGATARRVGRFQAAHGGTLFLDEVAELPLPAQAKLLRVLESGCFEPLGTNREVRVDVRVVSATHRDLHRRISQGLFREDLYYRLKVVHLRVPPLRERAEEIPALVQHFLIRFSPGGRLPRLAPAALQALRRYPFPGNVRELQHAVQQAVVLSAGGSIELEHLPGEIRATAAAPRGAVGEEPPAPLVEAIQAFEREYLVRALSHAGGNRTHCARLLGISRKSLWEKRRKHGITDAELRPPRRAAVAWRPPRSVAS